MLVLMMLIFGWSWLSAATTVLPHTPVSFLSTANAAAFAKKVFEEVDLTGLAGDLLTTFEPEAVMPMIFGFGGSSNGSYPSSSPNASLSFAATTSAQIVNVSSPGQVVPVSVAQNAPKYFVNPVNSADPLWAPETKYTFFMIDPDVPGPDGKIQIIQAFAVNVQLVVSDADELSRGLPTVIFPAGAIVRYVPPNPAPGSGVHRITCLLYARQPSPEALTAFQANPEVTTSFNLQAFVIDSELGDPIAGTFMNMTADEVDQST